MPLIPTPIVIPHTFQDNVGEANSGVQVNEDIAALKTPLETLILAVEPLLASTPLKVKAGKAEGTWGGNILDTGSIPHGLGKMPIFAFATPIERENNSVVSNVFFNILDCGIKDIDVTNVRFVFQTAPTVSVADGAKTKFAWIAVA